MRTGRKVLLIVAIVVAALAAAMAIGASAGMRYVRMMDVSRVDLSTIPDGSYRGSFSRGRFSYAVEVTVRGHRIEAVESTQAAPPSGDLVRQILDRILQEQSPEVETVSGASLTTKAVAKAVEKALIAAR